MTEQDWLASEGPETMFHCLSAQSVPGHVDGVVPRISERKMRLFACACCRQVWHLLSDERSRNAVEVAEQYADDEATVEQLAEADNRATIIAGPADRFGASWMAAWTSDVHEDDFAAEVCKHAAHVPGLPPTVVAALLREVAGNPYRQYVVVDSDWVAEHERSRPGVFEPRKQTVLRRWLTPTVLTLAQVAYDERPGRECDRCPTWMPVETDATGYYRTDAVQAVIDFGKRRKACVCGGTGRIDDGALDPFLLALLADALEEEGCTDEVVLKHLRGFEERSHLPSLYGERYWRPLRGPHVRGCFVLDLILGKE